MLTTSQALDEAVQATGLDNFGAPSFQAGLERLLDALAVEADLTPVGTAMAENQINRLLANRLRIEDWWSRHPELSQQVIERPLVIVGMSRSGTTALSHLLGKDAGLRSLRSWEAGASVPPPNAATYWTDERYLAAAQADALSDAVMPGFKALHHDPADAPVECNSLFAHEFNSTVFPTVFFIPSFFRWMMDADQIAIYDYHERMLKLLQSNAPGRWNLKGPQHGYAMDHLRRQYPDATLIVTHRDPAVCTASTASLITFLCRISSGACDPGAIGAVTAEFIKRCADGLIADNDTYGDDGMLHVPYPELVADPMGVVRRIYARIDRELSREAEAAMRTHIADRPQNKHGVHRYTMDEFALDRDELDEQFADYRKTFEVTCERR